MRIEISAPEVVSVFKEIQTQPEKVFEMIRHGIRVAAGMFGITLRNGQSDYRARPLFFEAEQLLFKRIVVAGRGPDYAAHTSSVLPAKVEAGIFHRF